MNNYHTIWSQERLYDSGQEPLFIFLWEKADLFLLLLATTKKMYMDCRIKKLNIIFLYFSFVICIYSYHLPFRGVMVKAMNCGIVVREFVLQSRYYVHFRANTLGKGMNPLILPPAMGK